MPYRSYSREAINMGLWAITGLLDTPQLRLRLGQGALELAQAFSWDSIARRTLSFYQSVIAPAGTAGHA